jgi:hypothetical protein
MRRIYILLLLCLGINQLAQSQTYSIILGRPTDTSITASIMFDDVVQYKLMYGVNSNSYNLNSNSYTSSVDVPEEIDLHNLLPNTKYYYKLSYKLPNASNFTNSPEYTFHTQRAPGSTFSFTIEADEHLYDKKGVKNMYEVTLANQLADNPDFMLSLGDIFGDDHSYLDHTYSITAAEVDSLHKDYRPFLGQLCHSVPFYVCLGNHEGENNYYYNMTPPNNLCIWGTQSRKYYYPNPSPNAFYSGNTTNEPYGIGAPENYFAWTWGDALFIVLDVYRDGCKDSLVEKPQGWNWTLGQTQYNWLKSTLENSTAKYKFAFAHHLRGQGRGAVALAKLFEWGGNQNNNGNYTFPQNRPGWDKPIHQLFVDNHLTTFFQGHDHVFAHETLDSLTYIAVPMAADSTYEIGWLANADAYLSDTLPGTGHIKVTVSPTCVKIDFVRAYLPADTLNGQHHNREIAFTKTFGDCSELGIKEEKNSAASTLFPNPANAYTNVMMKNVSTQQHSYQLLDASGRVVLAKTNIGQFRNFIIDTHALQNGVYFLQLSDEKETETQKLIIQH